MSLLPVRSEAVLKAYTSTYSLIWLFFMLSMPICRPLLPLSCCFFVNCDRFLSNLGKFLALFLERTRCLTLDILLLCSDGLIEAIWLFYSFFIFALSSFTDFGSIDCFDYWDASPTMACSFKFTFFMLKLFWFLRFLIADCWSLPVKLASYSLSQFSIIMFLSRTYSSLFNSTYLLGEIILLSDAS